VFDILYGMGQLYLPTHVDEVSTPPDGVAGHCCAGQGRLRDDHPPSVVAREEAVAVRAPALSPAKVPAPVVASVAMAHIGDGSVQGALVLAVLQARAAGQPTAVCRDGGICLVMHGHCQPWSCRALLSQSAANLGAASSVTAATGSAAKSVELPLRAVKCCHCCQLHGNRQP
jgi:hypothetical protein